jgi:hypothetical protein
MDCGMGVEAGDPASAGRSAGLFVAVSRFVIANGLEEEVCAAFRARPAGLKLEAGSASIRFFRKLCE